MSLIASDLPPIQMEFTEDEVQAMNVGRRQLKTEWRDALHRPKEAGKDWSIVLPFVNTYENAFRSMCKINSHLLHARDGRFVIFLNGTEGAEEAPPEVVEWIEKIEHPVAMKDFLAISFALDYDRRGGNPQKPQTEIGALRAQAKPYGGSIATTQTREAADKLVERCVTFLSIMGCYSSADCIVSMPPSDPSKQFNLPRYLSRYIAGKWGREDLSEHVTGKPRNSIKGIPLTKKLDTLLGTIKVSDSVFRGRNVLLLDDVYQSGVSMNYCALLLRQAGAKKILGLACEKTCRNDDNLGGKM